MSDALFSSLTAVLSFIAVIFLVDQHILKPRPYKLVWAIGLGVYGIAAITQLCATLGHWTTIEYRIWYLTGAILAAPYLGMGTVYLLAPRRWADRLMTPVVIFTIYSVLRVLTVRLVPRTNWLPSNMSLDHWLLIAPNSAVVNAGSHPLMPTDIVGVIIFLNSVGAFALVGGAAWSAWRFYKTRQNLPRLLSMLCLVVGGLAPTAAGSLTKFGISDTFFLLTFIGALFILAGYLISIDIYDVFRIPFTNHVLVDRRLAFAGIGSVGPTMQVAPPRPATVMTAPRQRPVVTTIEFEPMREITTTSSRQQSLQRLQETLRANQQTATSTSMHSTNTPADTMMSHSTNSMKRTRPTIRLSGRQ